MVREGYVDVVGVGDSTPDAVSSEDGEIRIFKTNPDMTPLLEKRKIRSREVFYAQTILIYIVAIACVINLCIGVGPANVWISMMSACVGFLLPNPNIGRDKSKKLERREETNPVPR